MILAPEGWYNMPDAGDADEYIANMLNPAPADCSALSDEKKSLGKQLSSLSGWRKSDSEAGTLPGSVLFQQTIDSWYPDRDVLHPQGVWAMR